MSGAEREEYMTEINKFYERLKDGRCKGCDKSRCVPATGGYLFLGCFHEPYKGKSVTEIKDCPKQTNLRFPCIGGSHGKI